MQSELIDVILHSWDELVALNNLQDFVQVLLSKNVFEPSEILAILKEDSLDNRDRFLRKFLEKDQVAFKLLVKWLTSSGNSCLARELQRRAPGITPYIDPAGDEDIDDELTNSIETEEETVMGIAGHVDYSKTPLEIFVMAAKEFRDTKTVNPNIPYYHCRSQQRGRVLIINNYEFNDHRHKTRTGAVVDDENLRKLFEQMGGWVVETKTNKTAGQIRDCLETFTKYEKHKECDICFVFIMSHGTESLNETVIYGTDGSHLSTTTIQNYFSNDNCPLYRSKPKVFIYQVCRGNELDLPKVYTEFDGKKHPSDTCSTYARVLHYRPVEDILIGYATMQGSMAHRDIYRGTWYIELICKYFMELAHIEPVDNLLMKVDEGLRKRISEQGTVQTSEHISKGFKKLYMNPGIYETPTGELEQFHIPL